MGREISLGGHKMKFYEMTQETKEALLNLAPEPVFMDEETAFYIQDLMIADFEKQGVLSAWAYTGEYMVNLFRSFRNSVVKMYSDEFNNLTATASLATDNHEKLDANMTRMSMVTAVLDNLIYSMGGRV